MARVALIHWKAAEAEEKLELIRKAGFEAAEAPQSGPELLRGLRASPPDAIVIDLNRLPSQGGAVGIAIRAGKTTRAVPIVFAGGEAEKVDRVKALLPDAGYCAWSRIGAGLRRAMKSPPDRPVVPDAFAGYSGTPLPKKLRIKEGGVVALLGAPAGFQRKLEPLPAGVRVAKAPQDADVILAFVRNTAAMRQALPSLLGVMREGRTLWFVWPKKTSPLAGDLGETEVRRLGLAAGLVDYKICAVDETWSGLAFAVRKKPQRES
jgi:CheY-like chemotaxis protein